MLAGVKRATEIVDMGNVTPEEWEMAKIEVSKRKVIILEREEEKQEIALKMIKANFENDIISQMTGLEIQEVIRLRQKAEKEE